MSNFKTVREKIDGLQERTNEDIEILGNRHFGVLTQNGRFAFGPVFFSRDDAEAFMRHLDKPVLDYSMSDLHLAYSKFQSEGTPKDRKLKGDLRELVEKWRNDSDHMDAHSENYKSPEVTELAAEVIDDLADELEGLINDE